jgi:putative transposase
MRKRHSAAFKAQVVQEILKEEKTIAQIASEHSVHPSQLNTWKAIVLKGLPSLFSRDYKAADTERAVHEKQVTDLYAEIGRLTTQLAWIKKKVGIEPDER